MYTTHPLPEALTERLEYLEEELAVPIRAVYTGGGVLSPSWTDQQSPNCSVESADQMGLTLVLYSCAGPRSPYYVSIDNAYDVIQSRDAPVAPIHYGEHIIGEVAPRTVYDYIGLYRFAAGGYLNDDGAVFDGIVAALRLSIEPNFVATVEERCKELEGEALKTFIRATYNRQIAEKRENIDGFLGSIASWKASIAAHTRMVRDAQTLLDALMIVQNNDAGEQIVREYELVKRHPRTATVRFSRQQINIVTTDDLRLNFPDGESRWLGAFSIDIDITTMGVVLKNLNTPRGGRDHPHVVAGAPCFGGHETGMYELLGRGELYTVFELILQYLETLNIHDEYGRYGSWWRDVEDERPEFADDPIHPDEIAEVVA